jgi:tetratricopeptide (TPR) repeat protein
VGRLAALLLAAGCAGPLRASECVAHGGRDWYELTSEHFIVQTDADLREAVAAVERLEDLRRALLLGWSGGFDPADTTRVIMLRDPRVLEEIGNVGGFTSPAEAGRRATLVIPVPKAGVSTIVAAHELTHRISFDAFPRLPLWLAEGLATYFETVEMQDDGTAVLGRLRKDRLHDVRLGLLPLAELWLWGERPRSHPRGEYYDSSWLWVHYLSNQHGVRFTKFQEALRRGADARLAWRDAFEGVTEESLLEDAKAHRFGGASSIFQARLPRQTHHVRQRTLSPDEVHVVRTSVVPWARTEEEAPAELATALSLNPDSLAANLELLRVVGDDNERERMARALVARHPEAAAVWSALGQVAPEASEKESAYHRALDLDANDALANNNLAWLLADSGRSGEALPYAQTAIRLAPWDPYFLDTYAYVVAGLGRCREAWSVQRRAMAAPFHDERPEVHEELAGRLAKYERCMYGE